MNRLLVASGILMTPYLSVRSQSTLQTTNYECLWMNVLYKIPDYNFSKLKKVAHLLFD